MKKIMTRAVLAHSAVGEIPRYRLVTTNSAHLDEKAFVTRMMALTGESDMECRYWLDAFRKTLFGALGSNESVDIGFMFGKLYVGGSIGSLAEQPSPAANPVRARIFVKGEFADMIRRYPVENKTITVAAVLHYVMQDGASEQNAIESLTERIVISGREIKIDPAQADNGVWLEDAKTGAKVADATVSYSDSLVCYVTFQTLPENGQYRLVVATRDGKDPAEYTLAKATRLVRVNRKEA